MFIELIRLGKDAELKQAGQTEILSLYAAYDVGFGDKKKAQWIGLTMFGKRAAQVAHMMTKGTLPAYLVAMAIHAVGRAKG